MYVDWWRSVSASPQPRNPLLVVVAADDADAVSVLAADHGARWLAGTAGVNPTSAVAAHLAVEIHVATGPELPDGHDLLLVAGIGRGMTTTAAKIACARFGAEPQSVVGFGSGIDDVAWMRKVADVRDREVDTSAVELMAQLLSAAADLEVPVLLDGTVAVAAAAICEHLPDAHIPAAGDEPSQQFLTDRMDVPVWGVSALPPGEGLGALGGLAALRLGLVAANA